ncbi:hypothetical protein OAN61_00655 [bacterium]|nr:hypothetical protein [bacterium]
MRAPDAPQHWSHWKDPAATHKNEQPPQGNSRSPPQPPPERSVRAVVPRIIAVRVPVLYRILRYY